MSQCYNPFYKVSTVTTTTTSNAATHIFAPSSWAFHHRLDSNHAPAPMNHSMMPSIPTGQHHQHPHPHPHHHHQQQQQHNHNQQHHNHNHHHHHQQQQQQQHHQHQPQQQHALVGGNFMRLGFSQDSDFPLRILVQSDMVGAIIGRSGSTIRQITQQSMARIDVHREESSDQQEKVITINGSPESCSAACFKIIDVIQNEKLQQMNKSNSSNNLNSPNSANQDHNIGLSSEIQLGILAHNNLIGRLIGRNGASIKKIMEQTSTKIKISWSVNSLADCTNERLITVMGSLDQVRQAEKVISARLRAAYLSDISSTLQVINQSPYLFNNVPITYVPGPYHHSQSSILSSLVNPQTAHGGHAISARSMPVGPHHQSQISGPQLYPSSTSYLSRYPNITIPPAAPGLLGFNPALSGMEVEKETVHIYIPSSMVGAIIGKSGSAIKEMISTSGASIKVAAAQPQPQANSNEPVVTSGNAPKEDNSVPQPTQQQPGPQDETKPNSNHQAKSDEEQSESKNQDDPQTQSSMVQGPQATFVTKQNSDSPSTRKVTIFGTPESLCSAQYLIYRKVSKENGTSDISLKVEIQIPSQFVGRLIGKKGATVKNIQKHTRTTIRLPDEKPSNTPDAENGSAETSVQIIGEFQCSQLAQRHIRNLIRESLYSSRQNNKQPSQSKHSQNTVCKPNAQGTFNNESNHSQHRSDNESISTPDDVHDDSSGSNEKIMDEPTHQSDDNPAQSESISHSALDINGNPKCEP